MHDEEEGAGTSNDYSLVLVMRSRVLDLSEDGAHSSLVGLHRMPKTSLAASLSASTRFLSDGVKTGSPMGYSSERRG